MCTGDASTGGKASKDMKLTIHSLLSSAKFQNKWHYTSTPSVPLWHAHGAFDILLLIHCVVCDGGTSENDTK